MHAPIDVRIIANLSPTDWWTICLTGAAGIVGAVVGGAIGLYGQHMTVREARCERQTARKEREQALAFSLLLKVGQIYSHHRGLNKLLLAALERAEEEKFEEPWQAVQSLANVPEKVTFLSDELTLLISLGENDLFNEIMFKDEIHNSAIIFFEKFSTLRAELSDQLPARMQGNIGHLALTPEQILILGPKMAGLNGMIASMRKFGPIDEVNALNILNKLSGVLNKKLHLEFKFEPKLNTGA